MRSASVFGRNTRVTTYECSCCGSLYELEERAPAGKPPKDIPCVRGVCLGRAVPKKK